jgi:hypothetical protein
LEKVKVGIDRYLRSIFVFKFEDGTFLQKGKEGHAGGDPPVEVVTS